MGLASNLSTLPKAARPRQHQRRSKGCWPHPALLERRAMMPTRKAAAWKWLAPRLPWLLPLLAALLALPSLWGGFHMDDHVQLAVMADRTVPMLMTPSDLFVFADGNAANMQQQIDVGLYPWWTSLDLKLAFFRPLAGSLMRLDYTIAGEWAPFYHAHSILWFVVLIAVTGTLYRRLLSPATAALGALLFTLDDAHALPAIWVANRNATVAIVFGLLALLAHRRARQDGWRPGLLLGPLALSLALLSAEAGLTVAAYLAAYELWAREEALLERLKHLTPYALVIFAYLALHHVLGYGTAASGVYLDPRASLGPWLQVAPPRALALVGGLLVNTPVDLWATATAAQLPLMAAGVGSVLLFGWLTKTVWPELPPVTRRHFKFLAGGALLSLVPAVSTFPSTRLLLAASFGAFGCLSIVLRVAITAPRCAPRWLARGLVLLHITAVFGWIPQHVAVGTTARLARVMIRNIDFGELPPNSVLISLFAPDPVSSFYPQVMREAEGLPVPKERVILSMSHHKQRFTRTADRELELEVIDGALMEGIFEKLVRAPNAQLNVGERFISKHVEAEIMDAGAGFATRVRFRFRRSLDDPTMVLLSWQDGGMRHIPAPKVGESLSAEASFGVFGQAFGM